MDNLLEHSEKMFSFHFGKTPLPAGFDSLCKFGTYIFQSDKRTPVHHIVSESAEILIYGYAVDLNSGLCDDGLANNLLGNADNIDSLLMLESSLGGKYLIFFKKGNSYFVIPDATSSIPLFYAEEHGNTVAASNSNILAEKLSLAPDRTLMKIRRCGNISQAMPYDLTEYSEIKQLIPNHYLDVVGVRKKRFVNSITDQPIYSPQEAAKLTAPKIETLARYYLSKFKTYCPITGGRDSRVVLAVLLKYLGTGVEAYTIRHDRHTGNEPDLTTPPKLAEKTGISYKQITDIHPDENLISAFDAMLGKGRYAQNTLMIANTIKNHFGDGCIINGDIIGQVGKCSLHRDISIKLAKAGYFRCKLHNYSKEAKKTLKNWLLDIKASGEHVNCFDLFSVESRMGRWAAQENIIYNAIGQPYFNIFNSRSIIYVWTCVDRALRKNSEIHKALIGIIEPSALDIPFDNKSSILKRLSKSSGLAYYLS